jgi:hypothetical protein
MLFVLSIIFRFYVDGVRVSARYVKSLAALLIKAAPPDKTPVESRRLDKVRSAAAEVDVVLNDRDRISSARVREPFLGFGSAFGALHASLVATSEVSDEESDRGARAAALLANLFPGGVSFTSLDARAAWAEGDRHLGRIRNEGLAEEVVALSGPDFLPSAIRATAALAEAIGVGETTVEVPSSTALLDAMRAFSKSVGSYCRALAAGVEDDDPASWARFRKAVGPIDEYRRLGRTLEEDGSEDGETDDLDIDGEAGTPEEREAERVREAAEGEERIPKPGDPDSPFTE